MKETYTNCPFRVQRICEIDYFKLGLNSFMKLCPMKNSLQVSIKVFVKNFVHNLISQARHSLTVFMRTVVSM